MIRTLLESQGVLDRLGPDADGLAGLDSNEPMGGVLQGRQLDGDGH